MSTAGINDTARWERRENDLSIRPEALIRELLERPDPPTAIIAGNNRMTVGALRVLRDHQDTSTALIGFDDFDTADLMGISVISYDPVELGHQAAALALERMQDPTGFTRQIDLPTWVIPRCTGERPV